MQGRPERGARQAGRPNADADDRSGRPSDKHAARGFEQRATRRLEQNCVHGLALLEHGLVPHVLDDVDDQVTHVGVVLEDQDSRHSFIFGG